MLVSSRCKTGCIPGMKKKGLVSGGFSLVCFPCLLLIIFFLLSNTLFRVEFKDSIVFVFFLPSSAGEKGRKMKGGEGGRGEEDNQVFVDKIEL
jgi:hypothetical protein